MVFITAILLLDFDGWIAAAQRLLNISILNLVIARRLLLQSKLAWLPIKLADSKTESHADALIFVPNLSIIGYK